MTDLAISRRTRVTPWTSRVEAAGVSALSVYNRMIIPVAFRGIEEDCAHLKSAVQVWDVAVERQVRVQGPDAMALVQRMTPRDLTKSEDGQCLYVPICDEDGGMLNDPVAVRHSQDHWWLSLADSDLLLWVKALALGMDVEVDEPDVNVLAVQGPKAEELGARLLGDDLRAVRFFRGRRFDVLGADTFVARSGWSKQGGFEFYVEDRSVAGPLWDRLFELGEDLDVRAGCPNLIERIEGGLLSYGNDMTMANTPYEAGLGKWCNEAERLRCIGWEALAREKADGPKQQIRGLRIEGERVPGCREPWPVMAGGARVGQVTSAVWSPAFGTNLAIGMVARDHWEPGTAVTVEAPDGAREAVVCEVPFRP